MIGAVLRGGETLSVHSRGSEKQYGRETLESSLEDILYLSRLNIGRGR